MTVGVLSRLPKTRRSPKCLHPPSANNLRKANRSIRRALGARRGNILVDASARLTSRPQIVVLSQEELGACFFSSEHTCAYIEL